ncbi:MAG: exo-alpha-sialidase [Clostridia bacterium]|nr:exo-alpha-sialidase [Clostridia bacterium]
MLDFRLVCDLPPKENNPRNSEGVFLRAPNGDILFAYSQYIGTSGDDHAACNIVMIRSDDEGEHWTEIPETIANASFFGTQNVMSVSSMIQKDGALAFYFLIKESDGTSRLGRTVSYDGGQTFKPERIVWNVPPAYYVINNDRIQRFSDGRLIAPAAYYPSFTHGLYQPAVTVLLISEDDGASFRLHPNARLSHNDKINRNYGLQEPGIIELSQGISWLWMRTGASYQYESRSFDDLMSFTPPEASIFTSPDSPMQVKRYDERTLYAVYNPIPNYNGRKKTGWGWGRTPLAIRKSIDNGKTFGDLSIIEDGERGFCYPALFFTNDGSLLCAYCRGGKEDGACLFRLGIAKIALDSIP